MLRDRHYEGACGKGICVYEAELGEVVHNQFIGYFVLGFGGWISYSLLQCVLWFLLFESGNLDLGLDFLSEILECFFHPLLFRK